MSPRGYLGNMFSTIHLLAAVGLSFHPELHVATISTNESPMPFWLYSNALRMAAFALRAATAVCTDCLVMNAYPSSCAIIGAITSGNPLSLASRP